MIHNLNGALSARRGTIEIENTNISFDYPILCREELKDIGISIVAKLSMILDSEEIKTAGKDVQAFYSANRIVLANILDILTAKDN